MNHPEDKYFTVLDQTFPTIAGELKRLWGTPEFGPYLEGLEQDNGIEHRVGFPENIMIALMAVSDEHDKQFPQLIPKSKWLS